MFGQQSIFVSHNFQSCLAANEQLLARRPSDRGAPPADLGLPTAGAGNWAACCSALWGGATRGEAHACRLKAGTCGKGSNFMGVFALHLGFGSLNLETTSSDALRLYQKRLVDLNNLVGSSRAAKAMQCNMNLNKFHVA